MAIRVSSGKSDGTIRRPGVSADHFAFNDPNILFMGVGDQTWTLRIDW